MMVAGSSSTDGSLTRCHGTNTDTRRNRGERQRPDGQVNEYRERIWIRGTWRDSTVLLKGMRAEPFTLGLVSCWSVQSTSAERWTSRLARDGRGWVQPSSGQKRRCAVYLLVMVMRYTHWWSVGQVSSARSASCRASEQRWEEQSTVFSRWSAGHDVKSIQIARLELSERLALARRTASKARSKTSRASQGKIAQHNDQKTMSQGHHSCSRTKAPSDQVDRVTCSCRSCQRGHRGWTEQ